MALFKKDRVDLRGAPAFTEGLFGSISLVTWVRSSRSMAASCSSPEERTLSQTPRPAVNSSIGASRWAHAREWNKPKCCQERVRNAFSENDCIYPRVGVHTGSRYYRNTGYWRLRYTVPIFLYFCIFFYIKLGVISINSRPNRQPIRLRILQRLR